jgi:multiple sugar transport system permease protein
MKINTVTIKRKDINLKKISENILMYFLLVLVSIVVLFPFYAILVTSFKTFGEAAGEFTWWPKEFTTEAYSFILGGNNFDVSLIRSFINTLIIVIPSMLVGLFVSAMSAYTFSKRNFAGRELLFSWLIATMMLPSVITMMPQYLIFSAIGWVDTPWPLMIPGMFGSATCIFFLRQFMRGIPTYLIEAAQIDGMNHFKIFIKIIIPLSVPALMAQGILWFIAGYNDYMGPLIYLFDPAMETLQLTLARFAGSASESGGQNIPAVLAGSVLTLAPLLIIYILAQKFFISGIAVSGIKG